MHRRQRPEFARERYLPRMPARLIRLTTLLTQLQAGRLITARSLADHHGVSLRTIYRDVRALEAAGVPVINVEGKGYSLLDGYRMPPVQFTEAEAGALITAEILLDRNKDASLARAYRSAVTKVIGISVRTSNADPAQTNADPAQTSADIGGLWQRWLGEQLAGRVPNKTGHTLYCVYTDYESDHTGAYTVMLGCAVSSLADIPKGMHGIEVPGGDFKRFTSKGNLQQGVVYHTWRDIWQRDLDRAYRADYEVYGEKALNPEAAEVEIFVGVR